MNKKIVAMALSAILICSHVSAAAQEANLSPLEGKTTNEATPMIIEEDVSLREESIKHFKLSDGSYTAVIYDTPIHYMQDEKWAEIDNTLVSASLRGEPLTGVVERIPSDTLVSEKRTLNYAQNDNGKYCTSYLENKSNSFNVQLPCGFNSNTPIIVNREGYSLRFQMSDIFDATAQITQPMTLTESAQILQERLDNISDSNTQVEIKNEFATTICKTRSSVSYKTIRNNIDLNYYLAGQTLKEDIVFHSLPVSRCFSFNFIYNDLNAVLQKDKSVAFNDEFGNTIFKIAAPCMFDFGEGYSEEIEVILEQTTTGCRYTLIPDREWLEADERIYPITLDPTIFTTQNTNYIHDNGVQQSNPNTNYKTTNRIYAGSASGSKEGRMYFKLTQWPSETNLNANTVKSARLILSYYPQASYQTAHNLLLDVYKLSSSWNTDSITWNNQTGIGGTIISNAYITNSRNRTNGYDVFDVTAWVKSHYIAPSTDYGIRLQPHTVSSQENRVCYVSSDYYANTLLRPIVYIDYYDQRFGLIGITDTGHNHTSFMNNPIPSGYSQLCGTDTTPAYTLSILRKSKAFISRSHGYKEGIVCKNGNMTRDDMLSLPAGALIYLELVYYGACSTGEGGINADNLVNATYEKGAKAVIGFTESVSCGSCNSWTKAFMESLSKGNTIKAATTAADKAVQGSPGGTNQRLERGDLNRRM